MRHDGLIGVLVSTLALMVAGCSSSSGSGSSTGGKSGSTGGVTGAGGAAAGTGGAPGTGGAAPAFTAVEPCKVATDYVSAADNTVNFGGPDAVYSPKCLKVTAGATVTFKAMGTETFAGHPLDPSAKRGTLTGNPITSTMDSSTMKTFTFPTPGFYAYYCKFHGFFDDGTFMAGVVWVQ